MEAVPPPAGTVASTTRPPHVTIREAAEAAACRCAEAGERRAGHGSVERQRQRTRRAPAKGAHPRRSHPPPRAGQSARHAGGSRGRPAATAPGGGGGRPRGRPSPPDSPRTQTGGGGGQTGWRRSVAPRQPARPHLDAAARRRWSCPPPARRSPVALTPANSGTRPRQPSQRRGAVAAARRSGVRGARRVGVRRTRDGTQPRAPRAPPHTPARPHTAPVAPRGLAPPRCCCSRQGAGARLSTPRGRRGGPPATHRGSAVCQSRRRAGVTAAGCSGRGRRPHAQLQSVSGYREF